VVEKEKIRRTKVKVDLLEQNNHENEDGVERPPCERHGAQQELFLF
jgi:hypothetical protein